MVLPVRVVLKDHQQSGLASRARPVRPACLRSNPLGLDVRREVERGSEGCCGGVELADLVVKMWGS